MANVKKRKYFLNDNSFDKSELTVLSHKFLIIEFHEISVVEMVISWKCDNYVSILHIEMFEAYSSKWAQCR